MTDMTHRTTTLRYVAKVLANALSDRTLEQVQDDLMGHSIDLDMQVDEGLGAGGTAAAKKLLRESAVAGELSELVEQEMLGRLPHDV